MSTPRFLTVILATLMLVSGTSAAQRPEPFTGAFDPEDVLVNLEQMVVDRDWKRYGDFLAKQFRFIPYSAVYLEYPTVAWDLWGQAREIGFVEELVSPSQGGATLKLMDNVLDRGPESRGRAEWDLVYTLSTRGQVFQSRAIFVFQKVDNLWFLREWIDTTIETDKDSEAAIPTSGSLRGALSQ